MKLKTYFIIINLLIAIIAFSYLVDAQTTPTTPLPTSPRGSASAPASSINTPSSIVSASPSDISTVSQTASAGGTIKNYFTKGIMSDFFVIIAWTGLGAIVGSLAGGEDGEIWGAISGLSGALTYGVLTQMFGQGGTVFSIGTFAVTPAVAGIGVGLLIFALTYKQSSTKTVEFNCHPYQAPIGGTDCEKCNDFEECSEYTCKSLGQACDLVNKGTEHQKCIWQNPEDVNSPTIQVRVLTSNHTTTPFINIRPPATGVEINPASTKCIQAFTPLEFTVITDEPAQCKIDYNITRFDEMPYFIGGDSIFSYNHTEELSLPGPDAINSLAPEIKNDGVYTLYTRCRDANGNTNEDAYAIRFCVEPGPDLTAPIIIDTSIPSKSPIQFNKTNLELEVYINEPAECKWSKTNQDYTLMENNMTCDQQLWDMNNENTYTCKTNLTGIKDRVDNTFYFKCKDQPNAEESDKNTNTNSYEYILKGTQPLNILSVSPNETVRGSTEVISTTLEIETDNGYRDGEATCYYSLNPGEANYTEFLETKTNIHTQTQELPTGTYTYYFKCVDLGGNADYTSTSFNVESDNQQPIVVRAYKESSTLKIITNEQTECTYSFKDCNFEIDDGIQMTSYDFINHAIDWKSKTTYIRCKDKYGNQPDPNTCSIKVKPWELGI